MSYVYVSLCLLSIFSISDALCSFQKKQINTENSIGIALKPDEYKYFCEPKNPEEETSLFTMEFEEVVEDSSRIVVEPWPISWFTFACDGASSQFFTTSVEGNRQFLRRIWCNVYKKGEDRQKIFEQVKKKIAKEHIEL